jgi:hypothetical protein
MKKTKILLSLSIIALLALGSDEVFSASQTTIKLQGQIVPSACDIAMDNPGGIKLTLSSAQYSDSASGSFKLSNNKLGLLIHCQKATSFAVRSRDIALNAGNVQLPGEDPHNIFSLGMTGNGHPIGGYFADIDHEHSWVDGKPIANFLTSENEGLSWKIGQSKLSPSGDNIYSWGSQTTPESAHQVALNIVIKPFIFNVSRTDAINIEGMTTFELVYL